MPFVWAFAVWTVFVWGSRIRNILANPKVCLVVDHYEDEDWSHLAWLQVRGEASLVEDEAERTRALLDTLGVSAQAAD